MSVDHLAALAREIGRVSALAEEVEHSVPVPHLDGWTVGDVVAHLVGDYRWVLDTVVRGRVPSTGIVSSAASGPELLREWDEVAAVLHATLAGRDPQALCPNFAQGERGTIAWQIRHTAFETTIHRADLELAAGETPLIDVVTAVEAIDELLATYTVRYSPHAIDAPLRLRATDAATGWRVTPVDRAGFVDATRDVTDDNDVPDITGPAASLLLLLWNRIDVAHTTLTARSEAAHRDVARFLAGPVTA